MSTSSHQTLVHIFVDRYRSSGEQTAIQTKVNGKYQGASWNRLAKDVRHTAAGLKSLGVKPGDRVAQIAENSYDWIVCDLAIQMARAIHVPVHASLAADQIHPQISDCDAKCLIVGDSQQYAKVIDTELQVVSHRSVPSLANNSQVTLNELQNTISAAEAMVAEHEACDLLTSASIATILYTSGTTGIPKGVVLSQKNLVSNTTSTVEAFGLEQTELRICFLPFSHVFARTCDLYTWILRGSQIALVESLETILPDCMRIGPNTINGVPYFFQRVHRYLVEQGKADEPDSLRKFLGGNIQMCCSGGAALPDYLYDFFNEKGVLLLQGYGLTESSPVIAVNSPAANRRGSVGKPIPGVEVKIGDDGEVLARGPNIMSGYWNNPDATKEILRNGWLHTGDLGRLDDDGFLSITGRRKEIIVTAGGKNIAPTHLEELLCEDPLIAQAVIVGEGRNFLTALIVPDPDNIRATVRKLRILPLSKGWVLNHPKIRSIYDAIIEKRLSGVSHYEQVRKYHLMDRGFTIETGEMTPKLSLKRKLIHENCSDLIDAMYDTTQKKPASWAKRLANIGRSF